jgi:superoxide dismutase
MNFTSTRVLNQELLRLARDTYQSTEQNNEASTGKHTQSMLSSYSAAFRSIRSISPAARTFSVTARTANVSLNTGNGNSNANANAGSSSTSGADQKSLLLQSVQLPKIERIDAFQSQNQGIPGLISADTLNDVWTTQINYNLQNLKDVLQESEDKYLYCFSDSRAATSSSSSSSSTSTASYAFQQHSQQHSSSAHATITENKIIDQYHSLLKTVSENFTDDSYLFNSASSIYTLYYFLSSLKANQTKANKVGKVHSSSLLESPSTSFVNKPTDNVLINLINKSFGSTTEFLTLLNDSAASIKGNGNTWLILCHIENSAVYKKSAHLAILNTYNGGLPHNFASNRVKLGKEYSNKQKGLAKSLGEQESSTSDSILSMDEAEFVNNIPFSYTPLLAIGSNPSFYLRDYGVYGKKAYVKNVLDTIDWNVVHSRIPQDQKS